MEMKKGLLKMVCGCYNKNVVDETAKLQNKLELYLLLYHYKLNPTELVCSQVKGYVPRNNTILKLKGASARKSDKS
jgi:sporulation-control protein spo0M